MPPPEKTPSASSPSLSPTWASISPVFPPARKPGREQPNVRESQRSRVKERPVLMADGVYRVTEVIGVSSESWEAAARNAVETAAKTVRDLRIAEVLRQDVAIENGSIKNYRVRLGISFKYESSD